MIDKLFIVNTKQHTGQSFFKKNRLLKISMHNARQRGEEIGILWKKREFS